MWYQRTGMIQTVNLRKGNFSFIINFKLPKLVEKVTNYETIETEGPSL